MYLGRLVELADAGSVFGDARHPYTRALLAAAPGAAGEESTAVVRGDPPSAAEPPTGCAFHPRCWLREHVPDPARCASEAPPVVSGATRSACHWPELVAEFGSTTRPTVTARDWQEPASLRWSYANVERVLRVDRIAAAS